jgi:hypothetical protein
VSLLLSHSQYLFISPTISLSIKLFLVFLSVCPFLFPLYGVFLSFLFLFVSPHFQILTHAFSLLPFFSIFPFRFLSLSLSHRPILLLSSILCLTVYIFLFLFMRLNLSLYLSPSFYFPFSYSLICHFSSFPFLFLSSYFLHVYITLFSFLSISK